MNIKFKNIIRCTSSLKNLYYLVATYVSIKILKLLSLLFTSSKLNNFFFLKFNKINDIFTNHVYKQGSAAFCVRNSFFLEKTL